MSIPMAAHIYTPAPARRGPMSTDITGVSDRRLRSDTCAQLADSVRFATHPSLMLVDAPVPSADDAADFGRSNIRGVWSPSQVMDAGDDFLEALWPPLREANAAREKHLSLIGNVMTKGWENAPAGSTRSIAHFKVKADIEILKKRIRDKRKAARNVFVQRV